MLDLEKIKARLGAPHCGDGYTLVAVNEGAQWLKDIRVLVAEVERLNTILGVVRLKWDTLLETQHTCHSPDNDLLTQSYCPRCTLVDEVDALLNPEPLQPCGHPRSAIVTARDLGGPGTQSCGMCLAEEIDRTGGV